VFPFDLLNSEAQARNLNWPMSKAINQKEVDRIASYVEACCELEREPFFGKDEKLTFRHAGNRWTFTFGDRFHFRSALISFRRLWMKKEPSNWEKTVEALKIPGLPNGVASFALHHENQIRNALKRDTHLLKLKMPSDRILDLWLNTVFAHGGLEGPNKRSEFEATVDQYGHAVFEYCFRSLVQEIGFEFLNISSLAAKPALDHCKQSFGLSPSFRLGAAFGAKRREKTHEGHIVVREGSSEFFSEETIEERFKRVLERYEHKEIQFVFKHLDVSISELLLSVLRHSSLSDVLESLGGRLELKTLKLGETRQPGQNYRASWAINRSRIDLLEDCVVVTDENGIEALNAALAKFRKQLLDG
jgi:hypothetical protein